MQNHVIYNRVASHQINSFRVFFSRAPKQGIILNLFRELSIAKITQPCVYISTLFKQVLFLKALVFVRFLGNGTPYTSIANFLSAQRRERGAKKNLLANKP